MKHTPSRRGSKCSLRIRNWFLKTIIFDLPRRYSVRQNGSRHNREQKKNKKVKFLLKATKCKSNSATDEVRVENRNHGFGNNKTVARLSRGTQRLYSVKYLFGQANIA